MLWGMYELVGMVFHRYSVEPYVASACNGTVRNITLQDTSNGSLLYISQVNMRKRVTRELVRAYT